MLLLEILFMISPLIVVPLFYWLLRNKSSKTKYLVGVLIGVTSLLILLIRNVMVVNGLNEPFLHPEIIPIQVCHFGNIAVFISLVFKNKSATALTFIVNLPFAITSFFSTGPYFNSFDSMLTYRAQTYIWGHLIIVLGAIYPIMFNYIVFDKTHVKKAIKFMCMMFGLAFVLNVLYNGLGHHINYFYAYSSDGLPSFAKLTEGVVKQVVIPFNTEIENIPQEIVNNFSFDWFYTLSIFIVFVVVSCSMFFIKSAIDRKRSNK